MATGPKRKQSRSDETTRQLIEAAIVIFAAVGYDGTTTRELATRAGVNISAIRYHFGEKEGLYLVAFKHIAANEGMNPSAGHALLFETERLLIDTIAKIVSRLVKQPPNSEKVRIRTMAMLGQVLVFQNSRAAALRAIGWKKLGENEIRVLQTVLKQNCRALMTK